MRVQAGRPITAVVAEAGIAHTAMSKWIARYRQSGAPALEDRSSAPPRPVPRLWTSSSTDAAPARVRPPYQPRARPARDSGVGTYRDPLAGQSQPEPPTRHPTPPGRPTGPANPSWPASTGRIIHLDIKSRTHPTERRLAGPRTRPTPRPRPPGGTKKPEPATPTCTPPSTAPPARPTPRPRMTRRPPPRSASSAAPGPSWPPTASSDSYGWSPTTGRATAPRPSPRPSLPGLAPPEDPPPHPTPQRQGRALQPHPGRGVPLRAHLHSSITATPSRCGTTATTTTAPPHRLATTSLPPPASQHTPPNS